jgi:hypothetical protein
MTFARLGVLAGVMLAMTAACSSTTAAPSATGDAGPYGQPIGSGIDASSPQDGGGGGVAPPPDGGAAWGPTRGPPLPAGKTAGLATGNQLPKLVLKDCDGNDYALDSVCGSSATWLFVAHGWCPYCKSVTKDAETTLASYAGRNLAAVNVLVENAASLPPTMTDCKAWRDTYALTNVVALYDPEGVTKGLFDAGSSALSVFIDKDRVIRSKAIHTDDLATIKAGIDGALAP